MSETKIEFTIFSEDGGRVYLPEHYLIAQLIYTAINDLKSRHKLIHGAARAWLTHCGFEPFDYLWCCRELNINPSQILNAHHALLYN